MMPIHDLLSRIRWDRRFGQGRFEIGYYDRRQDALQRVAFEELVFPREGHVFEIVDEAGRARRIPFHRVREVTRDGRVIWRRLPPESGTDA